MTSSCRVSKIFIWIPRRYSASRISAAYISFSTGRLPWTKFGMIFVRRTRSCPGVDQRGTSRSQDGNGDGYVICDRGAYEKNAFGLIGIQALAVLPFFVRRRPVAGAPPDPV